MKFKNNKESGVMVRIGNGRKTWRTVEVGETIDLPEEKGLAYGFDPLEEETESSEEVEETEEDKQDASEDSEEAAKSLKEELTLIKGVGKKTVDDLLEIYSTKEELLNDVNEGKQIPVRNDQEKKIKEHFENETGKTDEK